MKIKLYTISVWFEGDRYLVGNFCGKAAARKWLIQLNRRFGRALFGEPTIETGGHSLCGPGDFTSLVGSR